MPGKKHTDLTYLRRPNHLILKPIFAVFILKGTFVPGPYPNDWHDYDELAKIWAKTKSQIRSKNFIKSLEEFDIRTVKQS